MTDAKHTPPGDGSFRSSLVRNGAGALGLVVIVSAAFWAIGTLGGEGGTPLVSDDGSPAPEESPTGSDGTGGEAADGSPAADAGGADDAEGTDATGDADAGAEADGAPTDDARGEDAEDVDGEDAEDGDGEDGEDGAAQDEEPAVPPGEVTIQVLDGYKEDGGAAADQVADLLTGAGYDVIARNDALSYDATTVLYNAGHEAAARQVAAELGGAEVREQPGNLSTAVALHVVVGSDRG